MVEQSISLKGWFSDYLTLFLLMDYQLNGKYIGCDCDKIEKHKYYVVVFLLQGIQLYLKVIGHNDGEYVTDDLVDMFIIDITNTTAPVGFETATSTYSGIFGIATIELSFRVMCATNYYGTDCSDFCSGHNVTIMVMRKALSETVLLYFFFTAGCQRTRKSHVCIITYIDLDLRDLKPKC